MTDELATKERQKRKVKIESHRKRGRHASKSMIVKVQKELKFR